MAIQIRRGTDSEWESNKSNIVAGEPAVTLDSERMFVGTGSGTYMELANLDVLADAFDSSASYEVGDFVAYHGKVYKCNTDHSGAWNASDFDEVALADALDSLGEDVYTNLALKADKTETYTKAQVDSIVEDAIAEAVKESEYSNFEMKSVSGDFIHITDGAGLIPVKDLKIGIDAVQDLHGYDAPWVGGAGKNLIPYPYKSGSNVTINGVTFTVSSDGVVTVNGTASANAEFTLVDNGELPAGTYTLSGLPSGGGSSTFVFNAYAFDENHTTLFDFRVGVPRTETVESNINQLVIAIRIISGYTASNLVIKPQFEKGSTATDYAPYSNICPISGWTGAKVNVNGVNQWDEEWEVGIIGSNGQPDSYDSTHIRSKNYIAVMPSTTYCLRGARANIFEYDSNKNFLNDLGGFIGTDGGSATFTTGSNTRFLKFYGTSNYGATYKHDISVNYPSTDTDYHAYDGHVYSVTWQTEAGTVYGGALDVTTGELVVTHKYALLNNASLWKDATGVTNYRYDYDFSDRKFFPTSIEGLICSAYQVTAFGTCVRWRGANGVQVGINDSATTLEAIKALATNGDIAICYELATPVSYTLDPTEVLTLLGENNIFADTGAVEELIYRISRQ